jgi:hypothetical protein
MSCHNLLCQQIPHLVTGIWRALSQSALEQMLHFRRRQTKEDLMNDLRNSFFHCHYIPEFIT